MTAKKRPESSPPGSVTISSDTEDWIRQFSKHLEMHFADASRNLPADVRTGELQVAAARAIFATFADAGIDLESLLEMFGQAAIESRLADAEWNEELNERRFGLIDKEIQQSLTPAESVELAGLTRIMRHHLESELNLPMQGAQDLHRKLLELGSMGEPG